MLKCIVELKEANGIKEVVMSEDHRMSERKDTLNLLDLVIMDESDAIVGREMGRTLNVSEAGIMVETPAQLEIGQRLCVSVAVEDNVVEMIGRVMRISENEDGNIIAGVEFVEIYDRDHEVLTYFLDACRGSQK
jgi:hypothetical protein